MRCRPAPHASSPQNACHVCSVLRFNPYGEEVITVLRPLIIALSLTMYFHGAADWGAPPHSGLNCRALLDLRRHALSCKTDFIHQRLSGRRCDLQPSLRPPSHSSSTQFALRGTQPTQKDADLSAKFSEETMKVLEAGGASSVTLQRQVQLFASVTLLELQVGKNQSLSNWRYFWKTSWA